MKRLKRATILITVLLAGCLGVGCRAAGPGERAASSTPVPTESSIPLVTPAASTSSARMTPAPTIPAPTSDAPERILYPFRKDGKWGYTNRAGQFVIPPVYESAQDFSGTKAVVTLGENQHGYVDQSGNLSQDTYYIAKSYSNGYAAVLPVGLGAAALIDESGNNLFPDLSVRGIEPFSDGLARAVSADTELEGYVDESGKWAIPPRFLYASSFSQGFAVAQEPGSPHYGIIDKKGKWALPPAYERVMPFANGLAAYQSGGKWGVLDLEMKPVIPPRFAVIGPFGDDGLARAAVQPLGAYGYIDRSGEWRIQPIYREAGDFHHGLAAVRVDGKFGFIDTTGRMVIEPAFDGVQSPFEYDTAFVWVGDSYRYITREGEFLF